MNEVKETPAPEAAPAAAEAPAACDRLGGECFAAPNPSEPTANANGYFADRVKEFPPLPPDGSKVQFHTDGCAWKSGENETTIEVKLGTPAERLGFEKYLPSGESMGYPGHECAHATGAGFGVESPYGIGFLPTEGNQQTQNRGIEEHVRSMNDQKRDGVELTCRVARETDASGLAVKADTYQLYAQHAGDDRKKLLFEVGYEVEGEGADRSMGPNRCYFHDGEAMDNALRPARRDRE